MKTADFHYHLPEELIAQEPAQPRGGSRLLSVNRATGGLTDLNFSDLPTLIKAGDLLVTNDTRVIPARILAKKPTGGAVELLLLEPRGEGRYLALLRASKKTRTGAAIDLGEGACARVLEELGEGRYLIEIAGEKSAEDIIAMVGAMPLPPYIRGGCAKKEDLEWYQTVYAHPQKAGSAAAPTAGLHFTPELLGILEENGVERVSVTLHVGLGTFSPVRAENIADHKMHSEKYTITPEAAAAINAALEEGRRVVAVGTTATRTLEHAGASGRVIAGSGETDIFITPGYKFRVVGGLLTNFHLPESTLIMLVAAFAGHPATMSAYRHAVQKSYRFYSYGDAMFIG